MGDDVVAKCISNLKNKAALDTQKGESLGLMIRWLWCHWQARSTFRMHVAGLTRTFNIGSSSFSDLVCGDDTAFFIKDATDTTDCLSSFSHSSSVFGLHTSWPKTKLQSVGSDYGPNLLNVVVDGNPVDLVEIEFHLPWQYPNVWRIQQVGHHTSNWSRVLGNVVTQ